MITTNYRKLCCTLNKNLGVSGLVKLTWGNVSLLSPCRKLMYIKPSGVSYSEINTSKIAVVRLEDGCHLDGLKPSVDTGIHLSIYRYFPSIKSIIHTHSIYATAWAQSGIEIPILGTTHADYFPGPIPVIPVSNLKNLKRYEDGLGVAISKVLSQKKTTLDDIGAVLLQSHGALCFSNNYENILEKAIVLEELSKMAYLTLSINKNITLNPNIYTLFKKHYQRKNGVNKYYGQ